MLSLSVNAQVSIQPILPLSGLVQKNNLWNIAIINTSNNLFECRLEIVLRDRKTGIEVLSASSGMFTISAGAKQYNANSLMPIQYHSGASSMSSRTDDFVSIGNYIICYKLLTGTKSAVVEECISFDVEPISPPMLITPADSTVFFSQPSQFTWTPPAPLNLFRKLQYEIVIAEIQPGQKAAEAIQQNLPFYTENFLPINNYSNKGMATVFEKEKFYAWQVIAMDENNFAGKSEVWVFTINEDKRISKIIEETPFIKMKRDIPDKAVAPNSILKLSYNNEANDTIITLNLVNLNDIKKSVIPIKIVVKQGENLLQNDLKKALKSPSNGSLYEAYIINSRFEKWRLFFEVYNIENSK